MARPSNRQVKAVFTLALQCVQVWNCRKIRLLYFCKTIYTQHMFHKKAGCKATGPLHFSSLLALLVSSGAPSVHSLRESAAARHPLVLPSFKAPATILEKCRPWEHWEWCKYLSHPHS